MDNDAEIGRGELTGKGSQLKTEFQCPWVPRRAPCGSRGATAHRTDCTAPSGLHRSHARRPPPFFLDATAPPTTALPVPLEPQVVELLRVDHPSSPAGMHDDIVRRRTSARVMVKAILTAPSSPAQRRTARARHGCAGGVRDGTRASRASHPRTPRRPAGRQPRKQAQEKQAVACADPARIPAASHPRAAGGSGGSRRACGPGNPVPAGRRVARFVHPALLFPLPVATFRRSLTPP